MLQKITFLFLVLSVLLQFTISAQVIETEKGKIEFTGLFSKEGKIILDKIITKTISGDIDLCAKNLQDDYNIPNISVQEYLMSQNKKDSYIVVKCVDPVFKERVKPAFNFKDTLALESRWQKINAFYNNQNNNLLNNYSPLLKVSKTNIDSLVKSDPIKSVIKEIKAFNKESDKRKAIWTLGNDGNFRNRRVAILILSNFINQDSTLAYLVKSSFGRDASVNSDAMDLLCLLVHSKPRKVNWTPALQDLRYILDGANLFVFNQILEVLTKTGISFESAPQLLKGGGDLVIDNLKLQHDNEREIARKFLVQISGKDFGYNAIQWQDWIKAL